MRGSVLPRRASTRRAFGARARPTDRVSTRELVMMVGQLVAVISAHRNPASSRAMATGDDVTAGLAGRPAAGAGAQALLRGPGARHRGRAGRLRGPAQGQ